MVHILVPLLVILAGCEHASDKSTNIRGKIFAVFFVSAALALPFAFAFRVAIDDYSYGSYDDDNPWGSASSSTEETYVIKRNWGEGLLRIFTIIYTYILTIVFLLIILVLLVKVQGKQVSNQ